MSSLLKADFSPLIVGRLCHDLINAIGAADNGLKAFAEQGEEFDQEIYDLVMTSTQMASVRVQFFRLAFGMAHDGRMCARDEVLKIAHDYAKTLKIDVCWHVDKEIPERFAKLFMLGLLVAQSCLLKGGYYEISALNDGYKIEISGENTYFDPEVWAVLQNRGTIEPNSRNVHFFILHQSLNEIPLTTEISFEKARVVLSWHYGPAP